MRCISRFKRLLSLFICLLLTPAFLTGCGELEYSIAYNSSSDPGYFNVDTKENIYTVSMFADSLCVTDADIMPSSVDMNNAEAAILCDVNEKSVLFSKNANEQLYPASLTKIMTFIVAMKYSSLDKILTATNAVNITEKGAQLIGVKSGDTMTMDQALHILLIYSANDVANLIAENVAGSVEAFVDLMNEEANALGATNTHFVNPHGLSDPDHYTTAYDLYLIFNEAISNDIFNEIIHMTSYTTTYTDKNGKAKEVDCSTTNQYLKGSYTAPGQITVIGGKTGTTNAAGHCLVLLSRDTNGKPYISVILRSESRELLYTQMSDMLEEINK